MFEIRKNNEGKNSVPKKWSQIRLRIRAMREMIRMFSTSLQTMNGSICIFPLLILCFAVCTVVSVPLPRWIYRVPSCPLPDNVTAWIEASKNMNCFHDMTSDDPLKQEKVYHCLPSTYLNETVEFCGRSVPIDPGNCPIYNYEVWVNSFPVSYNCSKFTSGCPPKKMYYSKDAYKYSVCLKINRVQKCYTAEPNCLNYSLSTSWTSTIHVPTTHVQQLNSTSSHTTVTIPGTTFKGNKQLKSWIYVLIVFGILAVMAIGIVVTIFIARGRRILCFKKNTSQQIGPSQLNETGTLLVNDSTELKEGSEFQHRNSAVQNGTCTEPGKSVPMVDDLCKATNNWLYNDLLEDLKKGISKKLVKRIKTRLKDRIENTPEDLDNIQEPMDLLEYLHSKYKIFNNLVFLQGLFLVTKEPSLFDRCVKYANARQDEVFYVREQLSSTDHKKVQYVIDCPNISSYRRSELERLRDMLSTLIQAQFDDVIIAGIEEGCVIVTFMIRKCLIQNLRSFYSDKTSTKYMAYRWMMKLPLQYKVVKVIIEEEIVYADEARNVDNPTGDAQPTAPVVIDDLPECSALSTEVNEAENVDEKDEHPKVSEESLGSPSYAENLHFKGSEKDSSSIHLSRSGKDAKLSENTCQSLALEEFLEKLSGCITDDILLAMKTKLHEFIKHDLVKTMNTKMVFRYLMDKLRLQDNMCLLEWLFEKPIAPHLSETCRDFSSEHKFQLTSFCADTSECFGRECVKFHIMVAELETFAEDIYNLRFWISKSINVHPGEIIMTELQSGPVIVTYMLKEKHVNNFLDFIQTDDGRIEASRNRIEKIFHNEKFLIIGKALNGSTFLHLRLSYTREPGSRSFIRHGHEMVRNAVTHILRETNLPMQGTEAYVRVPTSDSLKRNDRERRSARDAIRKNWNYLKEEMEPQLLLKSELQTMFDEIDIQKVLSSEGTSREEQVEKFLKMCLKLPDVKLDKVWRLYLERFCKHLQSDMKEVSRDESLELESTKQWIISNWELLLDDIDSDFMETTLKDLKNVPHDICNSWSTNSGKSRKERAQMFLEFVLERHVCLKALAKTLQEYEISSTESNEC